MSDEETLPRNKTLTFTILERKLLLKLVNKHRDVVHNKKVDSKSTNNKNQAWDSIHEEFVQSDVVRYPRTSQQLKRCWENLRCKAKKGDSVAQKLLRWADKQYRLNLRNGQISESNGDISELMEDSDSSSDFKEESGSDLKDIKESLDESLHHLTQMSDTGTCQHCGCDKAERIARQRLLQMEKQQQERIYLIKVQNMKARAKQEKEVHNLTVHELTLRVENERRRAEILEKELSCQAGY